MKPKNMQTHSKPTGTRHLAWMAAVSLLSLGAIHAQTTAEKSETDPKDDEMIVLSPFVVDSSKDEGYRATSTLAGSRINTQLRDVAAPITVVTKEFMTDTAAVSINDMVAYMANAEGTRDFTSSTESLGRPQDNVSINANVSNRVRGLYAADQTRDYFYTISTWVGFDSYNLDQITVSRGPNSALAGLGSPAGIINSSPQMAGLARTATEVSYRFGSYGDQRYVLNSNIVAKKDVLGFRVAGVYSDRGFKQQPAWNKDKRLYGAFTYKPWAKTTIRGSYEQVKVNANNPNTLTPEDGVSQWVALGQPSFDRNSSDPVSQYLSAGANLPVVVYNANGSLENAINFTTTNRGFLQQNISGVGIFSPIRMSSNKYLSLDTMNVSPSRSHLEFTAFNLSVDQEILRNLHANVSYVSEKVDNDRIDLYRTEYSTYRVDVNVRTPWGAPNPHYGETYMEYRGLDNKQDAHDTNEVFRGTLTYDLDLTKQSKWLGRWRLTGFAERRETETERTIFNARGTSGSTNQQEIGYRYYLGGSATTPATRVPAQPTLVTGVQNLYLDAATNTYKFDTLTAYYALKANNLSLTKLDSAALVAQAFFWDDKIVAMAGVRRDKNQVGYSSSVDGGSGIVGPAKRDYGALSEIAETTKTYGVVAHPLKWLSLHYNQAENFIPNAGSTDLLGNPTVIPTGEGKDYGFSLNLLDNKFVAKFNWFELTAAGGSAGNPANFPLARWNLPFLELVVLPEAAAKAGINFTPGIASNLIVGDPKLENAYTSDNVSKGLEVELTYNVTKNWRVMASVSKQEAKQSNIAPELTELIEERIAYYKSINVWNNNLARGGSAWGLNQTGEEHFNQFLLASYVGYKSVDNRPSPQLAKWRASGLTNYSFSEGPLQGLNVGLGLRYIEKAIIGNPAIRDAAGTVIGLDLENPYYSDDYIGVDAWIGYKTKLKLFGESRPVTFQLNVRDLEEGGGFRPIGANSDGTHASFRIVQPRTFYLTTKLEF
jgi:outer membrane receptor protein involved in Fe transport